MLHTRNRRDTKTGEAYSRIRSRQRIARPHDISILQLEFHRPRCLRHPSVAVMRGTLGLDRPQAADLQPQTVNQRTVIGVAPPVMVVTLPVPFIRFFNAKKLVA